MNIFPFYAHDFEYQLSFSMRKLVPNYASFKRDIRRLFVSLPINCAIALCSSAHIWNRANDELWIFERSARCCLEEKPHVSG